MKTLLITCVLFIICFSYNGLIAKQNDKKLLDAINVGMEITQKLDAIENSISTLFDIQIELGMYETISEGFESIAIGNIHDQITIIRLRLQNVMDSFLFAPYIENDYLMKYFERMNLTLMSTKNLIKTDILILNKRYFAVSNNAALHKIDKAKQSIKDSLTVINVIIQKLGPLLN